LPHGAFALQTGKTGDCDALPYSRSRKAGASAAFANPACAQASSFAGFGRRLRR